MRDLNKLFKLIAYLQPIILDFFTLFLCFSFQPSQKKKKKQLGSNLGLKRLNCAKENFDDKSENFKKIDYCNPQ
jgi:hypothetical protein